MPVSPPDSALAAFGVAEPRPLGGRERSHWRVRRGREALVLSRYSESEPSVRYEIEALRAVGDLGWTVPLPLEEPVLLEGSIWTLASFLPGEPWIGEDEVCRRGRLLAHFHESVRTLAPLGARPGFRTPVGIADDPAIERTLVTTERRNPEEAGIVWWHWERARLRLAEIDRSRLPRILVHGDFTAWNLRYVDGQLSALLDFELAREDFRVAEFALAWRGKYDELVHAYEEVTPLEPEERAVLTPFWWLVLVDAWCEAVRRGGTDDRWVITKLRERSPLMGPDRDAFPLI